MSHDKRFDKIDGQLDKIVTTVVRGFDSIDEKLGTKVDKSDLKKVYTLMDKISKEQEIDGDERLVMGHQLERLDRWTHELAKKIGYELTT